MGATVIDQGGATTQLRSGSFRRPASKSGPETTILSSLQMPHMSHVTNPLNNREGLESFAAAFLENPPTTTPSPGTNATNSTSVTFGELARAFGGHDRVSTRHVALLESIFVFAEGAGVWRIHVVDGAVACRVCPSSRVLCHSMRKMLWNGGWALGPYACLNPSRLGQFQPARPIPAFDCLVELHICQRRDI